MQNEQMPKEDAAPEKTPNRGARFVPWLVIVALAILFVPLYLTSGTLDIMTAPLGTEEAMLAQTLTAPPAVPASEQTLTAHFIDVNKQLQALGDVPPTLIAAHVDWPAIMSTIHSYDANEIRLTGFNHVTGILTLEGDASQESSVIDYAHALQQTGLFSQVNVQSIALNPTPLATPNSQTTPTDSPVLTEAYMPIIFTISINLNEAGNGSH